MAGVLLLKICPMPGMMWQSDFVSGTTLQKPPTNSQLGNKFFRNMPGSVTQRMTLLRQFIEPPDRTSGEI